jgi:hypothetical protein
MAAGVLLLHEGLPANAAGAALRVVAFLAAAGGAWMLSVRGAPDGPPEGEAAAWIAAPLPTGAR